MGSLLRSLHLSGAAAELGVKDGRFTKEILKGWQQCSEYVQVDLWQPRSNYDDLANMNQSMHHTFRIAAKHAMSDMVNLRYAGRGTQCHKSTSACAQQFPDNHFDFIYVDARHDRLGVLEDLHMWWPKLKSGGVMAGHDYSTQVEPDIVWDPHNTGQNWTLNFDGSVDGSGRAVKGAVDDFFGGVSQGRFPSPPELTRCPRQISVTYHEWGFNTWLVGK